MCRRPVSDAPTGERPALDIDRFWRRGYALVPGVYTADEVAGFRRGVRASNGPRTDLLANPRLRSALTDGRLVDIARRLLDTDTVLYTGDSSYTVGRHQIGWHKDNADRLDPYAPDWRSRYTILRFGIYLQDHRHHTGGLNLRVASHQRVSHRVGRCRYVRSELGDVVVWSLRTTHSGNGMLLRVPWIVPPPRWQRRVPAAIVAADPPDGRMALFAALGVDDAHHWRYVDYLKTRTYMVDIWRNTDYDDDALAEARRGGLAVRDVPAEVRDDPTAGRAAEWEPLPY